MEESWAVFWATAVVVYGIYSLTLFPSTPGGDSGELLAESCHLGVVHPPGYPLLTMISYIASKLPLLRIYLDENNQWAFERHTTIAWRINHLCCIFGTLSATFIALSCLSILQKYQYSFRWGPSLVAGFLFAFSPVVWEHSIGAEVFSLNNLFCSLLIYLTILIYHSLPSSSSSSLSHTNQLYLLILFGAFLSGLTLSNQHASLLLLIVLIPFILLITYPYTMTLPYLISLSLVFSLAISSYFYLFFTSLHPSPGSWGDTTSFAGLIRHVLRSEYGTFQLGIREGSESSLERVYLYLLHSLSNGFYLNLPLCIIGLYSQFSRYPLIVTRKKIKSKVIKGSDPVSSSTDASGSSTPGHDKGSKLTQRGGGGKKNIKKLPEAAIVAEEENPSELLVPLEIVCLIVAWLAYVGIWHGVLSNIPLNSPMPYGVHARFWMQPDIIICIFTGLGLSALLSSSTIPSRAASILQIFGVFGLLAVLIFQRFPLLDRSSSGYVMHHYGLQILDAISHYPSTLGKSETEILLFSHTDLNWNTVRYLQACESLMTHVTTPPVVRNWTSSHFPLVGSSTSPVIHLNFQLIPFPWFEKQQASLYPTVNFPPLFKGVSTNRMSKENSLLIQKVLSANLRPNRVIFLDMQAINDAEIGAGGTWNGPQGKFLLIPFGMVYRVEMLLPLQDSSRYHKESLLQILSLHSAFPFLSQPSSSLFTKYSHHIDTTISLSNIFFSSKIPFTPPLLPFREKFPPGTWEHAVVSTYHDGHIQFGLNLLSYAMEMQKSARSYNLVAHLLDRYTLSSSLLTLTLHSVIYYLYATPSPLLSDPFAFYPFQPSRWSIATMSPIAPISSPLMDLLKNTALSLMRLESILRISIEKTLRDRLIREIREQEMEEYDLLTQDIANTILTDSNLAIVRQRTVWTIEWFLSEKGQDKDAEVFQNYLNSLKILMESEGKTPPVGS